MKLIGITGGIASGKSTVTAILRENGYKVIDLDQIARDVVQPDSEGLCRLIDEFGAGYQNLDGSLDRKKLANLVFNNKKELARLDAILGPLISAEVGRQRLDLVEGEVAFLDAALLFEKGMQKQVDGIILVTAPVEIRVQRAMERDNATEEHIRARISAQISDEEKRKDANFIIDNISTFDDLHDQVMGVLEKIRESF